MAKGDIPFVLSLATMAKGDGPQLSLANKGQGLTDVFNADVT